MSDDVRRKINRPFGARADRNSQLSTVPLNRLPADSKLGIDATKKLASQGFNR